MPNEPKPARPDLGHTIRATTLPTIAARRILAATRTPRLHRDCGPALLLLIRLMECCGAGDHCEMNYGQTERELGVPVPTLKKWARDLSDLGFITKVKNAHGVRVHVLFERLVDVAPAEDGGRDDSGQLLETLRGMRSTMNAALDGVITRLGTQNDGGATHEG